MRIDGWESSWVLDMPLNAHRLYNCEVRKWGNEFNVQCFLIIFPLTYDVDETEQTSAFIIV